MNVTTNPTGYQMKNTILYLDEAKKKLGFTADNQLASWMGVTRAAISNYRLGKSVIDDYAAAKIAGVLEIDPMVIISAANAEREKDEGRKEFWKNFYERLGGIAAAILVAFVTLIVTLGYSSPLQAAPLLDTHSAFADDIHYAKL